MEFVTDVEHWLGGEKQKNTVVKFLEYMGCNIMSLEDWL